MGEYRLFFSESLWEILTIQKIFEAEESELLFDLKNWNRSGIFSPKESCALNKLCYSLINGSGNLIRMNQQLNIIIAPLFTSVAHRHYLKSKIEHLALGKLFDFVIYNSFVYPSAKDFYKITGIDKIRFLGLLKAVTFCSLRTLIEKLRLYVAMKKVLGTSNTITDIAYDCGYSNISAFSRSVQMATGYSPTK